MNIEFVAWAVLLVPLLGAVIIGGMGHYLGRTMIAYVAITGVTISFGLTGFLIREVFIQNHSFIVPGFTWLLAGNTLPFKTGLWIDPLSVTLLFVVTSISWVVHVYSIAYMRGDPSYRRYFSYLALFTFSMLTLVGADNSLQLFFGWEGVGLTSYLLIGFWFQRPEVPKAALKAFLMNRAGDIGLFLGLALLIVHVGSAGYNDIFNAVPELSQRTLQMLGYSFSLLNIVGILLFVGVISKSAQIPLQVWLPDSMVGPTPVSALMHAATMVTAGIYMVARLSPIFEAAPAARAFILVIGATTALLLGIVALVQTDIKRVIAFSTISQLGYMTAGLGVSAYTASILHLVTHAYFKALLFLAAGSVILALDHEQALNKMGGLWKRLPITYGCFMIGALALMGLPPFSGFYSKDLIINAVYHAKNSHSILTLYAFYALLAGVLITALYTGRLIFLIFHGPSNLSPQVALTLQESARWITLPLLLLAIPAIGLGWLLTHTFKSGWLNMLFPPSIPNLLIHDPLLTWIPTLLSITGLSIICVGYSIWPLLMTKGPVWGKKLYKILASQYGLEKVHQRVVITVIQKVAKQFVTIDTFFIDRLFVQGSTKLVQLIATRLQLIQSGWLYHYLLIMIMSLMLFLIGVVIRA
jgi:NADH-quinone oxidoreductase subunit L